MVLSKDGQEVTIHNEHGEQVAYVRLYRRRSRGGHEWVVKLLTEPGYTAKDTDKAVAFDTPKA